MTETQWRSKKDAPTDGTPIIIWTIYSAGGVYGARFGEVDGPDGKPWVGWFTYDPLAENGYGGMEIEEDDDDDFLWIPFPQWEITESLAKALIKGHKESLEQAKRKPVIEDEA